ncbi:sce7725 family protein [Rhodococcus sp. NPDC057297]|uniref:sce7725 family protein n=1 Tax=Rhodococcus sp. NPDC057297 TaxID=3346090 RepID=UPI00362A89EA
MYFPYLRGKQFELLAIKELAERGDLAGDIQPVIEPVRPLDNGALDRTLAALNKEGVRTTLIINPLVGEYSSSDGVEKILKFLEDSETGVSIAATGVLVDATVDLKKIFALLSNRRGPKLPIYLFHKSYNPQIPQLVATGLISQISANFAENRELQRLYDVDLLSLPEIYEKWRDVPFIRWKDHFVKLPKNLDYISRPEQLFSADAIYQAEENWLGLCDYQTVGHDYSDGGRLPWAVAIHLTYQKSAAGPIFISHFCSDSNDDASDTAGKFGEALAKLVRFAKSQNLDNPAIAAFKAHLENRSFPGLGSVKKISIQNHVYVMKDAMKLP